MKNPIKRFFIIALALCLCICSSRVDVLAANKITQAQDEKENLIKKKTDVETMLKDLEKKKSDTLVYIQELDTKLAEIEAEVARLDNEINKANEELAITQAELEEAKITEANQYESMKKRIQYMYMNGNKGYLQILLDAESMSDFLNKSEYIKQISEYDRNMLSNYQEAKQLVIDKEAQIEANIKQLEELNAEVEEERKNVEVLLNEKNNELQNYNNSINESENAINSYETAIAQQEEYIEQLLEAERKRIEEEERRKAEEEARRKAQEEARKKAEEAAKKKAAEEAASKAAKQASSAKASLSDSSKSESSASTAKDSANVSASGFMWPCPASGRITSRFGYRDQPTAGASTFHKGLDIGAPTGSNIIASKSGTVVTSSYGVATGYYVMIYHGNGVYTYYMHCSKLLVEAGDTVSQGDVIAQVGSTGVSTGPHLHFAITVDGSYVDPANYVSY